MKYIKQYENNMSDKVKPGDYVYYHNIHNQHPFIIKVNNNKSTHINISLILYKENNEWKLCKEDPYLYRLDKINIPKESFNRYCRLLTSEELKDVEYKLTAVDYNL
jgi:hypothetical protein